MTIIENVPNSEGNLPASSAAEDTGKDCETLDLLRVEENYLIAFHGCNRYQFNVIQLIKSFYTKEVTFRVWTIGDIVTILSMTSQPFVGKLLGKWINVENR